jgi:hypothetical protein
MPCPRCPHHVHRAFQGLNHVFFLPWIHFGINRGVFCQVPECLITEAVQIPSCQQTFRWPSDGLRQRRRYQ